MQSYCSSATITAVPNYWNQFSSMDSKRHIVIYITICLLSYILCFSSKYRYRVLQAGYNSNTVQIQFNSIPINIIIIPNNLFDDITSIIAQTTNWVHACHQITAYPIFRWFCLGEPLHIRLGLSKTAQKTKMLFGIEMVRSHSILGQIKKCHLGFEPIIHQINVSAIIFHFG